MVENMIQQPFGARIAGVGAYLPPGIVTNEHLEQLLDTDDEWIKTRTGISQRHIAHRDTATSDLATGAAKQALESAGILPSEVGMVIVATATPDMIFPSTACLVQRNIGAGICPAFDLEAACTGFIYALSIAKQFVASGCYNNILVIGAETFSRIVDWRDRNTCVLFGDGAGAVIVQRCEPGRGIIGSTLRADGNGGDLLFVPGGGSKNPADMEMLDQRLQFVRMNGQDVYKFAVRVIGDVVGEALQEINMGISDIDLLVPHQANLRIIEAARKKLSLDEEKIVVTLNKYGNMSAASIPVALYEAMQSGRIHDNDIVVLVGFGAGLTWGANIIKW